MTIRAQLVTDWLPRKFTSAVRASLLFYAPLLLHVDHQGAGLPAFTRAGTAQGTWRDGALHTVAANEPVFEYAAEAKLGLLYGRAGVGGRSASDECRWTSGTGLTKGAVKGSYAFCCDPAVLGTLVAIGETYDYSAGPGAGIVKTYTSAGLHHQVTDATAHPTLHDGRLVDIGPFNRHLRHVTTFRRVLTAAEMADLLAVLEAA
jgi:hypothetical protein